MILTRKEPLFTKDTNFFTLPTSKISAMLGTQTKRASIFTINTRF